MALVLAALAISCAAQAQAPAFEVASVKRNGNTPSGRMNFQTSAGRLTVENMPLRLLIQRAYDVRSFQITGGPAWIDSERYDIAAKAEGAAPEKVVAGAMLQGLLAERFRLKVRREIRELPALLMTLASRDKLRTARAADCTERAAGESTLPCHEVVLALAPTGVRLRGEQVTTGRLTLTLANVLGRPVIDRTEFGGRFDLDVEISMDGLEGLMDALGMRSASAQANDAAVPSLFTALPRELGLKLNGGRGQAEVLVIEHVERPAEN